MLRIKAALLALSVTLLAACSTTQTVTLAKTNIASPVKSVAQVPGEDNSPQMDANLNTALQAEGVQIKAPLPVGTRKSDDADAIITYVDVWRWDIAMYLKKLSVKLYDAKTGDLLVMGDWEDSHFHGFRDAKAVMQSVVSEMMAKVRDAAK